MVLTCGCEVTVTAPARIERACEQHGRISLRDHFAGQALAGLLSNSMNVWNIRDDAARVAYQYADAMLEERGDE